MNTVWKIQLKHLILFLFTLPFAISFFHNAFLPIQSMYSSNAELRINLYKDSKKSRLLQGKKISSPESNFYMGSNLGIEEWVLLITSSQPNLKKKDNYKIISVLQTLAKLSRSEKKKTLLFIPQSNRLYWNMQSQCESAPFIAPAITGIAMIDGLPSVTCDARNYSYNEYNLRTRQQSVLDKKKNVLCSKALSKGFSQIIVIDADEKQNITNTKLSCP